MTAMQGSPAMQPDYFGADGGKLAMAFASGCVATFAFMAAIGGFIWKLVGKDRIEELAAQLAEERRRCAEMEQRLVTRIEQLETILLFETAGNVRQNSARAIAELHEQYRERIKDEGTGQ